MLKPLNNTVVLEVEQIEQITGSGLLISGKSTPKNIGKVTAISKEINNQNVTIGDFVVFSTLNIERFEYENSEYILIDVKDILAVVEGK